MAVVIDEGVRDVFFKLSKIGKCKIAGGYIRDQIHGVQPKDADIILHADVNHDVLKQAVDANIAVKINAYKEEEPKKTNNDEWGFITVSKQPEYDFVQRGVVAVYGCSAEKDIDIIVVNRDTVAYIEDFDFGINQAWWDGEKVGMTKKFVTDHLTKELHFSKEEYKSSFRLMERGRKIAKKLGFKFDGVFYIKNGEPGVFDLAQAPVAVNAAPAAGIVYHGFRIDEAARRREEVVNENMNRNANLYQHLYGAADFGANFWEEARAWANNIANQLNQQRAVQAQPRQVQYQDWRNDRAVDRLNDRQQARNQQARDLAQEYLRRYVNNG